jgi:hypothetical protein
VAAEGGSGERDRRVEEAGRARGSGCGVGKWSGIGQQRPGCGTRGRRVATRQWRAAGSGRRGTAWLTGGPARDGARSSVAGCGARQRGEAGRRDADKWGWQHSAPNSVFKPNQVYFKRIQIWLKF